MFADRTIIKLSLSLDRINVWIMQRKVIHWNTMNIHEHQIRKENSSIAHNWSLRFCHPTPIVIYSKESNYSAIYCDQVTFHFVRSFNSRSYLRTFDKFIESRNSFENSFLFRKLLKFYFFPCSVFTNETRALLEYN